MALLEHYRPYGIRAAKVAAWDASAETWGTPVVVRNLQSITIKPVMDNDKMRIYGADEHALAIIVAEELEMEFGGIDSEADEIMTGRTATDSGSGASETRRRKTEGGEDLPYFGMAVQIAVDGGGDIHVYFPRVKLKSLLGIEMAKENKFAIPKVTADVLRLRLDDGTTMYPVRDEVEHKVATALTSDFNTAFVEL
jgi:hypothetical protein